MIIPTETRYTYDLITRASTGPVEAPLNLDSPADAPTYLAPINSVPNAPPSTGAEQAAQLVSVEAGGTWQVVVNFCGQTWFDQTTGAPVVIETVGQPAANLAITQSAAYLAAQEKINFKISAQVALSKSDVTISRCVENSVSVPAVWATYRKALRAIVDGSDTTSTTLPIIPSYPAGT